jgi:hypothetical protein
MIRQRFFSYLVCGLAIALAVPAGAQVITGSVIGSVRDDSGAVMPGATVTIASPTALPGGPQTAVTNEKGQYRFISLPPGTYSLIVSLSGFATYNEEGLRVSVGGTTERIVTLRIAAVAETVTVTGESPIVDTKKSGVSANFANEVVENTPVRRFSMFDFLKWSPGISATSPSSGTTASLTAFGSSTNDNQYLMDGTDFTSPVGGGAWPYPDTDTIEEVEVVALGASAEYGNLQGAVFNVVTKQGGNSLKFDLSYFAQPDELTSKPIKLDCDCPLGETGFTRGRYRDFTGHAGGPIVKDRLWFYAGYQHQRDYDNQPGTDPAGPRRWKADRANYKVTWQVTPKLKFMSTYHDDYWEIPAIPTIADPFETTNVFGGNNPSLTFANLTHVVSDATFWDFRFTGFVSPNDYARPNSPDPTLAWRRDIATGIASGGSYSNGSFTQTRLNVAYKVTHYATDFMGGDHDFKFGIQYSHGSSRQTYAYPGGGHYYDYDGEPYYAYLRAPYTYGGQVREVGLFAEDSFRPSDRLTLNLGVRADLNKGISQDIPAIDNQLNETGGTVPGLGDLFSWNSVSPRLGFNLKLTEDGRTLLRGNYGRFYQRIITGELSTLHPGITPITLAYFDPATGRYSDIVGVTDPIANLSVDRDTRAPNTDQLSIGFDRELAQNIGIGATYVYKKGRDYTGFTDVAGVYGTGTAVLPDGRTINTFPLLSDPDGRVYELTNPEGYSTEYNALLLNFQKRWSNNWQAVMSYTLSKAEGLITSNCVAPHLSQTTAAFAGSRARCGRDPNDLINATGNLLNDRTHMFRVQTAFEVPRVGVMLGANLQYLTGKPYAGQANVRLPQGTRQIYVEPLGTRRLPPQTLLDFRVSKIFRFGQHRLEVLMDVLNLLQDEATEQVVTRNFFSTNFGEGAGFIDPRRAMIGVKFKF